LPGIEAVEGIEAERFKGLDGVGSGDDGEILSKVLLDVLQPPKENGLSAVGE
jgi:hypothetical protein